MAELRDRHSNSVNGSTSASNHHGFDFGDLKSSPQKLNSEHENSSPQPRPSEAHSKSSNGNNGSVAGVADFFSPEVFQIVLHNPATAHQLLKFSQARFCGENMEFLERVDRYNTLLDELTKTIAEIHKVFTAQDAPKQLNLSNPMMKQMNTDIKMTSLNTLPAMELMFTDAQERIEQLLANDIYPRFVKHQMTSSAVKALAEGRGKYAGLGDCFVLTNPNIADNPITFASDGFVKVTGYSRADIIPRNCRFLQGTHTDRSAVRRLRSSIEDNKESVELLLNYRKSGEPFWNLLYVTPLLDSNGKTAFFLAGQINCSTTIHNCSDILRLLSTSEDSESPDDSTLVDRAPKTSSTGINGFFRSFRGRNGDSKTATDGNVREAGMEQNLIKQIGRMNFRDQMETFYTAYSRFLVLGYDSFLISYFSTGVTDMLCLDPKENLNFVGNNIFKILNQHAPSMSRDFKSRVKSSLKAGRAVSVDISLLTKRSIIYKRTEAFVTHWTPLKDETGNVKYVVVTLASST